MPALSILWVMDDHTGGPPTPDAEQADNDLAVGRIIDYISHSNVWSTSAIFIEEDDAQNGVDHVDGHRSPGYIVSPYAVQNGPTDHTYYTQVNMTRTIEQILGLPPMNQFDLVASPMRTAFVKGTPPAENFKPWTHVPNQVPLDQGVTASDSQPTDQPCGQGPEGGLAPEEGADLRRQTDQARLRRPGHRQPSELVHVDRVYAALSRREQGSPPERLQQAGAHHALTWTSKTRRYMALSPTIRGEAIALVGQAFSLPYQNSASTSRIVAVSPSLGKIFSML